MKRRNAIVLAAGFACVLALAGWALRPRPVAVETAVVSGGAFELTVSDDGRTRVRDRYTVSAPLAGRMGRIVLRVGDPVEKGQVLAVLAPAEPGLLDARAERELRERVGSAEAHELRARAEARRMEAQRDQALADRERQRRLAQEGFVSPTGLEQAELALQVAERAVESARFAREAAGHEVAQARAALTRSRSAGATSEWRVTAPVAGAVLKVMQESEGNVVPGMALVEIADPRSLEAIVDVLSQESIAIRPGMAARVELGPAAPVLAARVRHVEPAAFTKVSALGVEEQRVNVVLDFVDPLDGIATLGDAFRVEAAIVVRRLEQAVKIPTGALFRDGEGWAAYRVEAGRAFKRPVAIELRNATEAVATGGVGAGDRVVVYPPDSLRDGSRVREK